MTAAAIDAVLRLEGSLVVLVGCRSALPADRMVRWAEKFLAAVGKFLACGTCLKIRNSGGSEICPLSTLKDHYEIVRDSDKLVTV